MNYSNLTISELDRIAANSDNALVIAMNVKMQELIQEIEFLTVADTTEVEGKGAHRSDFEQQFEYIKKLCQLPDNY
jgi:hypothetical protein